VLAWKSGGACRFGEPAAGMPEAQLRKNSERLSVDGFDQLAANIANSLERSSGNIFSPYLIHHLGPAALPGRYQPPICGAELHEVRHVRTERDREPISYGRAGAREQEAADQIFNTSLFGSIALTLLLPGPAYLGPLACGSAAACPRTRGG